MLKIEEIERMKRKLEAQQTYYREEITAIDRLGLAQHCLVK